MRPHQEWAYAVHEAKGSEQAGSQALYPKLVTLGIALQQRSPLLFIMRQYKSIETQLSRWDLSFLLYVALNAYHWLRIVGYASARRTAFCFPPLRAVQPSRTFLWNLAHPHAVSVLLPRPANDHARSFSHPSAQSTTGHFRHNLVCKVNIMPPLLSHDPTATIAYGNLGVFLAVAGIAATARVAAYRHRSNRSPSDSDGI